MKRQKQKGVLLLCTLAIMVILSILLMVGVYRMQASTMVTKKAIWEIKSYWAAQAGNTIAADSCLTDPKWPNVVKKITFAGKNADEGYNISYKDNFASGIIDKISGIDKISDSSFTIYYMNHIYNNPSNHSASSNVSETVLQSYFNDMKNKLGEKEIYCLTAGKSGASVVGLEFVYRLNNNYNLFNGIKTVTRQDMQQAQEVTEAAAVFSTGIINVYVKNKMHIKDANGDKPVIVSTDGNININGGTNLPEPVPNENGTGILDIDQGYVFLSEKNSLNINGTEIKADKTDSNLSKYNLKVYPIKAEDVSIDETKIKGLEIHTDTEIPSGTFCFIEMPKMYYTPEESHITIDTLLGVPPNAYSSNVEQETWGGCYLSPEQYYDAYFKKILSTATKDTLKDVLKGLLGIGGSSSEARDASVERPIRQSSAEDYFKTQFNTLFDYYISSMHDDKGFIGDAVLEFNKDDFKYYYEMYLRERINATMDKYVNTTNVEHYEPMFIPDGYAGLDYIIDFDNIYDLTYLNSLQDKLKLNFSTFTRARIYSELLDELYQKVEDHSHDQQQSPDLLSLIFGGTDYEKAAVEIEHIKNNLKNIKQIDINDSQEDIYMAKKIKTGDSYFTVLHKMSEYDVDTGKFNDCKDFDDGKLLKKLQFSNTDNDGRDLKMTIKGNCKVKKGENGSNGFFNFATFERVFDKNTYQQAKSKRAVVKLDKLGKSSLEAGGTIAIRGVVEGNGHLVSDKGDIIFEVGSSVDAGEEYNVALIAKEGDIKLKKVSAVWSSDSWKNEESSFKGIFRCNNLLINAKQCSKFTLEGIIICKSINVPEACELGDFWVIYNPEVSANLLSYLDGWDNGNTFNIDLDKDSIDEYFYGASGLSAGDFKFINRI